MAISSVKEVKKARWIASMWAIPGISGAFLIGIVGMAYFGEDFFIGKDPEIIMPLLAQTLLPGWLAGLLISGAVAAMMSTADSQLLVSTSAISEDLGISAIKKRKESDTLLNTRIITVLLGIFAYIVAMYSEYSGNTIFSIVSFAWSGLGSSFGPAVISGLFTGAITTLIWGSSPYLKSIVTERLSSFVFAFLAIVIVSKYKKRTKANTENSKNSILQSGSYGVVVEETKK
jgi:sodium/proline symporter